MSRSVSSCASERRQAASDNPTRTRPLDTVLLRLSGVLAEHGHVVLPTGEPKVTRNALTGYRARFAGWCQQPRVITIVGRPSDPEGSRYVAVTKASPAPMWVEYEVPCRKCPHCNRNKRMLWRNRAVVETLHAQRTWFGTLTFRPDRRVHYRYVTAVDLHAGGEDLDALDEKRQFREVALRQARAHTLAMKRLREDTKAQIRYLFVTERHQSGDAHFHMLLHEQRGSVAVTKRQLDGMWHEGFSRWKLVGEAPAAAGYIAKYIAKDPLNRVRASLRYGIGPCLVMQSSALTSLQRERKRLPPLNAKGGGDTGATLEGSDGLPSSL